MFLFFLLLALHLLLASTLGIHSHLRCFCHGGKGTVGGEVKHIALRLLATFEHGMGLHTEDGLHVVGGRCIFRTLHAQHGSPFGHAHTRGQFAAREGDGIFLLGDVLLGIATDIVFHIGKGTAILILDVAVACCIDDMEHAVVSAEDVVLIQQFLQCGSLFHSRQEPEGVLEVVAELIGGEGVHACV